MTELKSRCVEDDLIAVVDGLKGFPEAITAVLPQAMVQTCVIHLPRHSIDFVSWKDRKPVAAALQDIYQAVDASAGEPALTTFEDGPWGKKYPAISQSWRRAEVVRFYALASDFRRILLTNNAIEALNSKLRRVVRARDHFPTDEVATRLLFRVLNRSEKQWIMLSREWHGQGPVHRPLRRALHIGSHAGSRLETVAVSLQMDLLARIVTIASAHRDTLDPDLRDRESCSTVS